MKQLLVKGDIVYACSYDQLSVNENSYILIEDGKVVSVSKEIINTSENCEFHDYTNNLIIPAFNDIHLHAVQYVNTGLGYDKELIPWLTSYTFPEEKKFNDLDYAKQVFTSFIDELWRVGTMRSCIFSSLHYEATKILIELLNQSGLSAYVGKVNMDRNGIEGLQEDTDESIKDTARLAEDFGCSDDKVKFIITPRFSPSCTNNLMRELGELSYNESIPVQSHINENLKEILWVKELFPESKNYYDSYKCNNLIREGKTILAHGIYNSEDEEKLFIQDNIFIAHCPSSNFNLSSGIMKAKRMLKKGIKIGLGSDIAGGETLLLNRTMVDAVKSSKILNLYEGDEALTIFEAFFLGTRGGGEFFGNVGCFEEGFEFDALVINDEEFTKFRYLTVEERLEKYVYLGDDRQIKARYLSGKLISRPVFNK